MKIKYSSGKVEWEFINQLLNAIENQNIRNQVGNALEWYVRCYFILVCDTM